MERIVVILPSDTAMPGTAVTGSAFGIARLLIIAVLVIVEVEVEVEGEGEGEG